MSMSKEEHDLRCEEAHQIALEAFEVILNKDLPTVNDDIHVIEHMMTVFCEYVSALDGRLNKDLSNLESVYLKNAEMFASMIKKSANSLVSDHDSMDIMRKNVGYNLNIANRECSNEKELPH